MYNMVITYNKSMDQPGKAANPARGQLNRENEYSPVPVRTKFSLANGRNNVTHFMAGSSPRHKNYMLLCSSHQPIGPEELRY